MTKKEYEKQKAEIETKIRHAQEELMYAEADIDELNQDLAALTVKFLINRPGKNYSIQKTKPAKKKLLKKKK
jgi:hypothetical protein